MPFLPENYPAFKPLVLKSLLGSHEINNNVSEKSDIDDKGKRGDEGSSCSSSKSPTPNLCQKPKPKKRKINELKEYQEERD